jgi:hypothetical protein
MKLFFTILFSLSLMSVFSIASATPLNPTLEDYDSIQDFLNANPGETVELPDGDLPDVFFIFIQIVQKDNNGLLIGYLESHRIMIDNKPNLDKLVEVLVAKDDLIYPGADGTYVQAVRHETSLGTDSSGLLATIQFNAMINNETSTVAHISHDGMRLNSDEVITSYWTFLRFM